QREYQMSPLIAIPNISVDDWWQRCHLRSNTDVSRCYLRNQSIYPSCQQSNFRFQQLQLDQLAVSGHTQGGDKSRRIRRIRWAIFHVSIRIRIRPQSQLVLADPAAIDGIIPAGAEMVQAQVAVPFAAGVEEARGIGGIRLAQDVAKGAVGDLVQD